MTRKLQILRDEYNKLRGEYWLSVIGDDRAREDYLYSRLNRLEVLIAAQQARAILASEIKQLDKVLTKGGL